MGGGFKGLGNGPHDGLALGIEADAVAPAFGWIAEDLNQVEGLLPPVGGIAQSAADPRGGRIAEVELLLDLRICAGALLGDKDQDLRVMERKG